MIGLCTRQDLSLRVDIRRTPPMSFRIVWAPDDGPPKFSGAF